MQCEHKFIFLRNYSYYTWVSRYSIKYVCIDTFYCEKCSHAKDVKKEVTVSDTMRDTLPDWAKVITNKLSSEYSL